MVSEQTERNLLSEGTASINVVVSRAEYEFVQARSAERAATTGHRPSMAAYLRLLVREAMAVCEKIA